MQTLKNRAAEKIFRGACETLNILIHF
jgi:hypothetical protein